MCDVFSLLHFFFWAQNLFQSSSFLIFVASLLSTDISASITSTDGAETLAQVAQRGGRCPALEKFKVRLDGALST